MRETNQARLGLGASGNGAASASLAPTLGQIVGPLTLGDLFDFDSIFAEAERRVKRAKAETISDVPGAIALAAVDTAGTPVSGRKSKGRSGRLRPDSTQGGGRP